MTGRGSPTAFVADTLLGKLKRGPGSGYLEVLGLPAPSKASDLETGEAIPLAGTGGVRFALRKHA